MPSAIEIGGDIVAAGTALAGLLLVFLGAISTTFDSYEKREQGAVVKRYRRRANFALIGFMLSLASAAFALIAKWLNSNGLAMLSLFVLLFAFLFAAAAAIKSVLEIR